MKLLLLLALTVYAVLAQPHIEPIDGLPSTPEPEF